MARKKKASLAGYILACVVLVGLVFAVVGMFLGYIGLYRTKADAVALFDSDAWKVISLGDNIGNTFGIIAFIVAVAGCAVLALDCVLRLFAHKSIKLIGVLGAVAAIAGGVCIIVSAGILCGQINDKLTMGLTGEIINRMPIYGPALGAIFGTAGSIVAGVAGLLGATKFAD